MLLENSQEINVIMSVGILIGLLTFTGHLSSRLTSFFENNVDENNENTEK